MSKLGYIQNSYGKQFNIGISNTYGTNILSGINLPANTLIISSPIDEDNNDIGSYSIFVTDSLGNPVRLTYTISQGNGLNYSQEIDSLKLDIDNDTIIEQNHQLTANISNLIDNYTIKYENDKINIDLNNINKSSEYNRGLFKIDDNTIKSDNGKIYVDTDNLKYVNKNTSYGICIGDGNTIISKQGVLSINQDNLSIANNDQYGIVSGVSDSINFEDGVISVITDNLDKCSADKSGVISIDNSTIKLDSYNQLTIDTENLNKLSLTNKGVFKYDDNVFNIENNSLTIKDNEKFINKISTIKSKEDILKDKINNINQLLDTYKVGIIKPMILDFHCCDVTTAVLEKPDALNEQIYSHDDWDNYIDGDITPRLDSYDIKITNNDGLYDYYYLLSYNNDELSLDDFNESGCLSFNEIYNTKLKYAGNYKISVYQRGNALGYGFPLDNEKPLTANKECIIEGYSYYEGKNPISIETIDDGTIYIKSAYELNSDEHVYIASYIGKFLLVIQLLQYILLKYMYSLNLKELVIIYQYII